MAGAAPLAGWFLGGPSVAPYDLVVRGATVFDGTGAAGRELNRRVELHRLD